MNETTERLIIFLAQRETHVYNYEQSPIEILVFMDFEQLVDFEEILGEDYFEESINVNLCYKYVVYNLTELFECGDEDISDYKDCFDAEDWDIIIKSEEYKEWADLY